MLNVKLGNKMKKKKDVMLIVSILYTFKNCFKIG